MSETLLFNTIGEYEVSTIRTDAGGAAPSYALLGIFCSSDYEDLTTWPFETMVFPSGSRKGLYHEPYSDEESARAGHARIVKAVDEGTLEFGSTVEGPNGTPRITPDEWRAKTEVG